MNRQIIWAVSVATFALMLGGCATNRGLHEAIGRGGALYDLKQIKSDLKKVYFDTTLILKVGEPDVRTYWEDERRA